MIDDIILYTFYNEPRVFCKRKMKKKTLYIVNCTFSYMENMSKYFVNLNYSYLVYDKKK